MKKLLFYILIILVSSCQSNQDEKSSNFKPTKRIILKTPFKQFILNGLSNSSYNEDIQPILDKTEEINDFEGKFQALLRNANEERLKLTLLFRQSQYPLDIDAKSSNQEVIEALKKYFSIAFQESKFRLEKKIEHFTSVPFKIETFDPATLAVLTTDKLANPKFYKFLQAHYTFGIWKMYDKFTALEALQSDQDSIQPQSDSTISVRKPTILDYLHLNYNARGSINGYDDFINDPVLAYSTNADIVTVTDLIAQSKALKYYPDLKLVWGLADSKEAKLYALENDYTWTTSGALLDGKAVDKALVKSGKYDGNIRIQIILTPQGGLDFSDITQKHIGKPLAIVLNDQVISVPIVQSEITDGIIEISGGELSKEKAQMAVMGINNAGMPLRFQISNVEDVK